MPKIHRLKIEPMTEESFRPFGELMDAEERPTDQRQFSPIDFQADEKTTVNVIWQPYQGLTFTQLERHFAVTQSFIQLAGSPAVVAAALPTDLSDPKAIPNPDQVRAFLIDKTKGFAFKKGTWHSLNRYILSPPGATFVILNSRPNPTQIADYEKGFGLTYSDLDSDQNPTKVDFGERLGITFEVVL